MTAEKYRHAEEEYFKLRGQFDTGRITQEKFDEKLRDLMVQDEQGRYWMLGADSGKWYFYDGAKWVQGDPYPGASGPLASSAAPEQRPPPSAPIAPRPASYAPPAAAGRKFPLVPVLIAFALIVLAVAAFLVFQNRNRIFVAQQPQLITPVLPPTITRAPSPTAPVIVPTVALPTLAPISTTQPTLPPLPSVESATTTTILPNVTTQPGVTVIIVTAIPPTTETLPTLLPSATIPAPTVQPPTATLTKAPPTATTAPPTKTALPPCPSGVCVTKIEYAPSAPKRNQDVTFTATFLNSTGGAQSYNWLILMYDPEKPGNNKGFGESPASNITVPTGESKFSITYTPVNGPGGCKNLYMRAGWKVSAFEKPLFPNTSGDPVTVFFDVCP
ncbi:MAG: hypothetical protein HY741_06690 [Chloroflexi bacterium]|nr:hypothetical protein [Chloroflexota bacterium]